MKDNNQLYSEIKNIMNRFVEGDFGDDENLLGITSVRNIIYVLDNLESKYGLKINEDTVAKLKEFTLCNLTKMIYSNSNL